MPMRVGLEPLHQRLLEEQRRLTSQLHEVRRSAVAEDDVQKGDGADAYEQDRAVSLAAGLQGALDEVEHALQKIGEGTYGRCDGCGGDIPFERLQILPQAALCVQCKSQQAKGHR